MKTNAFSENIPNMKEIFDDIIVEENIKKRFLSVLSFLGIENPKKLIDFTISQAKKQKLDVYERNVHKLLDQKRITQRIPVKLSNRAQTIFDQVKDYVDGHLVLDLGSGDGKVGELIAKQGRQVVLSDVYEHGNIINTHLPFVKIKPNKTIPFNDNTFDTILLLTVLHHSDDPEQVITEARRVAKKDSRIIVIESVFGLKEYDPELSFEQQRLTNIFFDHFYNRIIHYSEHDENKINVPFNFQTPNDWKKFFTKNSLCQEKLILLGFDQPTVPEYHTLHILKVKK